jgi:hypothetical protein
MILPAPVTDLTTVELFRVFLRQLLGDRHQSSIVGNWGCSLVNRRRRENTAECHWHETALFSLDCIGSSSGFFAS